MSIYTTDTCFGCHARIDRELGTYYCLQCIDRQTAEANAERQAFDDFHAYADKVAKITR